MTAPYRLCIGMLRPGELRCLCGGPNQLYVVFVGSKMDVFPAETGKLMACSNIFQRLGNSSSYMWGYSVVFGFLKKEKSDVARVFVCLAFWQVFDIQGEDRAIRLLAIAPDGQDPCHVISKHVKKASGFRPGWTNRWIDDGSAKALESRSWVSDGTATFSWPSHFLHWTLLSQPSGFDDWKQWLWSQAVWGFSSLHWPLLFGHRKIK